jgi:hypothetical protein
MKNLFIVVALLLSVNAHAQRLKYHAQRTNVGYGNTPSTPLNAHYDNFASIENDGYIATAYSQGYTQFSFVAPFNFIKSLSRGGSAVIAKTDSNFRPYKVTETLRAINLGSGDVLTTNGAFDKNKNVYFYGDFAGDIDIAPGGEIKVVSSTYNFPNKDGIVAKYDSAANLKWCRKFNSLADSGYVAVYPIKAMKNGDIYIAVYGDRGIQMDSSLIISYNFNDIYTIIHLDMLGNLINHFETPMETIMFGGVPYKYYSYRDITITENHTIYASFEFFQSALPVGTGIDLDHGIGIDSLYFLPNSPNYSYCAGLVKLDSNFN